MLCFFVNNYTWKVSWLLLLPAHTPSPLPQRDHRACWSVPALASWFWMTGYSDLVQTLPRPAPPPTPLPGRPDPCFCVWTSRLPAVWWFCFCPLLNKQMFFRTGTSWSPWPPWQRWRFTNVKTFKPKTRQWTIQPTSYWCFCSEVAVEGLCF